MLFFLMYLIDIIRSDPITAYFDKQLTFYLQYFTFNFKWLFDFLLKAYQNVKVSFI